VKPDFINCLNRTVLLYIIFIMVIILTDYLLNINEIGKVALYFSAI